MVSGLISALLTLCGVAALWAWRSYRMAMKRAHGAILDSQKRVLDAAQTERDQTDAEIDRLGSRDLAAAIDDAFRSKSDLHSDDAD